MFLDQLKKHVLILDGAMGTMVQKLNLDAKAFGGEKFQMLSDILVFSRPKEVKNIHIEYLKAGANIIETNSFGATSLRLCEFDFSQIDLSDFDHHPSDFNIKNNDYLELSYYFSYYAAKIAKEAILEYKSSPEYDGRPLYVAGSIGPTNRVLSATHANLQTADFDEIENTFKTQVTGLIDGGADVLLFETQQDQLELKAGILGARKAMAANSITIPIMAQVSVNSFGKMPIFNTDLHAAYTTIQDIGIDVFGINCNLEPAEMVHPVKHISEFSEHFISVVPNAGQPKNVNGSIIYDLTADDMAVYAEKFVKDYGVNIVGGCCGSTPEHIKAIRSKLKGITPKERQVESKSYVSGPQEAVLFESNGDLIKIGERLNVRGSKKVRKAVEGGSYVDFDALEDVINDQMNSLGLSILDICMDSNVVTTEKILPKAIHNLTSDFKGVFCIDSFSEDALEKAIKVYPGKPIINSISLEDMGDGKSKLDIVLERTSAHKPIYVALAADSSGPAKTAEEKVEIARRIIEDAKKYGIPAKNLIIDLNAFPIGSETEEGMNFALESLKAMPLVKKLAEGVKVSMGVGNLTAGLSKKPYMRVILTSIFLDEALKVGLDAAIINPNHFLPPESLSPDDVVLARKVILEHDMDAFVKLEEIAVQKAGLKTKKKKVAFESLPVEERVPYIIKEGVKRKEEGEISQDGFSYEYKDKIVEDVWEAVAKYPPLEFINNYLMEAVRELGDAFGRGEVSLPQLLKSTDIMKHAMNFLEAYIHYSSQSNDVDGVDNKGTVVLGTVYQDVHSIGKDLVKTLLENYGYKVVDLGVQVNSDDFVAEVKKNNATALGLSALLVQTSTHMIEISKKLKNEGIDIPILIGGAAVNLKHAYYVAMRGEDAKEELNSNVFYCKSAMDAVKVLDNLGNVERKDACIEENKRSLMKYFNKTHHHEEGESAATQKAQVDHHDIPLTDLGVFHLEVTPEEISNIINSKMLYKLNWKYGSEKDYEKKGVNEDQLNKLRDKWLKDALENKWITPIVHFGLFPVKSDDLDLIFYDPVNFENELGRMVFNNKVVGDETWNVPMYFHPVCSRTFDLAAITITSAGPKVDEKYKSLMENNDSESAFLLRGLADRIAEDLAEHTQRHITKLLNLDPGQAKRFSPGYPLIKDLKNNSFIYNRLIPNNPEIKLTDAYEFVPTCTTSAVICFNKNLSYKYED